VLVLRPQRHRRLVVGGDLGLPMASAALSGASTVGAGRKSKSATRFRRGKRPQPARIAGRSEERTGDLTHLLVCRRERSVPDADQAYPPFESSTGLTENHMAQ
jgi:hypothetical protein